MLGPATPGPVEQRVGLRAECFGKGCVFRRGNVPIFITYRFCRKQILNVIFPLKRFFSVSASERGKRPASLDFILTR